MGILFIVYSHGISISSAGKEDEGVVYGVVVILWLDVVIMAIYRKFLFIVTRMWSKFRSHGPNLVHSAY